MSTPSGHSVNPRWRAVASALRASGPAVLGALLGVVASVSQAQTPPSSEPASAPSPGGDASAVSADPGSGASENTAPVDGSMEDTSSTDRSVPALQAEIERSMMQLEAWAREAHDTAAAGGQENAAAAAACFDAMRSRGNDVMEVATGELLLLQEGQASDADKALARAKLGAASAALAAIQAEALRCTGEEGLAVQAPAQTEVDTPSTIPMADPTLAGTQSPVPPPVDLHSPVTVGSPSL